MIIIYQAYIDSFMKKLKKLFSLKKLNKQYYLNFESNFKFKVFRYKSYKIKRAIRGKS